MKKRRTLDTGEIVSIGLLIALFIFFAILSDGKLVSIFNMRSLIDQSMLFIIAGLGAIFVVSTGGADLSLGATLGLTTVVSGIVAQTLGSEWFVFPVAIVLGLAQGFINGILVAKLKVPSFMATLAFLIGIRGLMLFIQAIYTGGFYTISGPLKLLKLDYVKFPILIALIIVFMYILQKTRFGNYCRAIGENEAVAINIGIPVAKVKIIAFMLSSLMAAVAGFFSLARFGGTNNAMGANLEMNVLIGIFVGGVLVSGGYGSKVIKLLIGCLTVAVIQVGMSVSGYSDTMYVQIVEGVLLIVILWVVMRLKAWDSRRAVQLDVDDIPEPAKTPA
jgi:ribose transport system permease protein